MTPDEFAAEMRFIYDRQDRSDIEADHIEADKLLLKMLRELGYGQGCDIFEEIDKWYA